MLKERGRQRPTASKNKHQRMILMILVQAGFSGATPTVMSLKSSICLCTFGLHEIMLPFLIC